MQQKTTFIARARPAVTLVMLAIAGPLAADLWLLRSGEGSSQSVVSPGVSYLNAIPSDPPPERAAVSSAVSFLNAIASEAPEEGLAVSATVSYLNAQSEANPETFSLSPLVSYDNDL